MQNVLSYLNSVLDAYWEQSRFQLLLYFAIGTVLLMEKKKWKRVTFGWFEILCFLGLMNPITVNIAYRIWGESIAYYCRQFSLIPTFIIIAYALTLMYIRTKKGRRIAIVIFFVVYVVMNGNFIYSAEWYTKAENFYKVPKDVVEICEYFDLSEEKVRVAAPVAISPYLRQCKNIIQIQGRYVEYDKIEAENLQSDKGALEALQIAAQNECDYLIVKNDSEIKREYIKEGYESCYETNGYLIYKVSGFERWKRVYDEENRLISNTYIDSNGNNKMSTLGYSTICYTYGVDNKVQEEKYYDQYEKPIALINGEYAVKYKYDKRGNIVQLTYLDENDNTIMTKLGYSMINYTYDRKGNRLSEHYYDNYGRPQALSTEQYGCFYEYDENDNIIEVKYVDRKDDVTIISYGYGIVRYWYDNDGNKAKEFYYDDEGKPQKLELGQFGCMYSYNEKGHVDTITYIDENGEKMERIDGISSVKYIYDTNGNRTGQIFYNLENKEITVE